MEEWLALSDTELTQSSLFPYNVAYVCSTWNKIRLRISEFWTRVFIDIGSQGRSILQVRRELEASQDQAIEVYISRRDGFGTVEPLESRRMDAFMKVFACHIHRCLTLRVQAMHQSSLILLRNYLSGKALILDELQLYSHCHDSVPLVDEEIAGQLYAPGIFSLALDSCFFHPNLFSHQWITLGPFEPSRWINLTVMDLSFPNVDHALELSLVHVFCVTDEMIGLPMVHLSLIGVRFNSEELQDIITNWEEQEFRPPMMLVCLTPKNLQPSAVAAIFKLCFAPNQMPIARMDTLTIGNCPISDVAPNYVLETHRLDLRYIEAT